MRQSRWSKRTRWTGESARRRQYYRRMVAVIFKLLVTGALLGSGGYAFCRYIRATDDFRVRSIYIAGNHLVDTKRILQKAGITNQDNLYFLDTEGIRRRLVDIPYIASARVIRYNPDAVIIEVTERKPVMTLLADNRAYIIDGEGVVLQRTSLSSSSHFPYPYLTSVPDLGVIEVGKKINSPVLENALAVYKAFQTTQMAKDVTVSEIAAHSTSDIEMICDELPYVIRWGRGNCVQQAKRLDFLWQREKGKLPCREYCDLRFDNDVVCK